jgi:hypothetical protein
LDFILFQVVPPEAECSGGEPATSIEELTSGAELPAAAFPASGRVSVSEPVDDDHQVRRRDKDIKAKRKLNETPSMLDPVNSLTKLKFQIIILKYSF